METSNTKSASAIGADNKDKSKETLNEQHKTTDAPKSPIVLCKGVKDHECSILGVRYEIKKGQDINVPKYVSLALQEAGVVIER